ncbi:MAG: hypothetical protein R2745_05815 [Vicinamibacterales bacterium]
MPAVHTFASAAPASLTAAAPFAPVPELVVAPDGCIVECDPAAAELFGLASPAQALGVHLSLFCRDAERLAEALGAAAVTGRLERWDADFVRVDGKALPSMVDLVAAFDEPRALSGVRVSIKPLSAWPQPVGAPARPVQRDEAGQLSHELNNLLAIIGGHAECLAAMPGDAGAVDAIRRAVASAAQVSVKVRALGQAPGRPGRAVDIDAVLAAVQDDLRRTFGHRLGVIVQPAPHPWTVAIDRAVVHHALAALSAEAVETMPHGGTLTFRTMNVEVGRRHEGAPVAARPGRYVRVEVSYQTATPAAPAPPRRRDVDEAGVTALEALRRAGGRIVVDTDGVRIATVGLLLPSDGMTVLKPRDTSTPQPTGRSVMVVEQDATHRRLLQAVLRGQGHEVDAAESVADAEPYLALHPDAVLVTDRVAGDTAEAGAAWLEAHPDLRILGTSDEAARAVALAPHRPHAASITRPLAAARVIDAVRGLCDGDGLSMSEEASAADVLAHLWLKHDDGEPIHPLEAS